MVVTLTELPSESSGDVDKHAEPVNSNGHAPTPSRSKRHVPSLQYPIRALAALTWLFWSSRLFVEIGTFPTAAVWSILFGLGAIALLSLYAILRSERAIHILDNVLVIGTLVIGIIWVIALVYGNPNFGTDEAAFVQGAAQLVTHGHNPYGVNLSWTLQKFAVQPTSYTYTTTGHLVTHLNYPALSFLPEAALIALGISTQSTIWVCALFLAASGVVMLAVVPRQYRPLAALLLGFDAYFSAAATGLIFTEMMLFIVIAFVSWEGFVDRVPGWRRWISPIALGLAISVQQDSWFLIPCLLVAVYQEARLRGHRPWASVIRYSIVLGSASLAVNLPFFATAPSAWVRGVFEPLSLPLMPLGQGLIGLTTYLGLGGGDLPLYTITSMLVLATLVFLLGFHYERTRFLVPIIPAIVLWFSTRSLQEYVLIAAYGLLVAMCCWRNDASMLPVRRVGRAKHLKVRRELPRDLALVGGMGVTGAVVVAVLAAAALGALTMSLTSKAPLSIRIVAYHSTGEEQTVDSLEILVHNRSQVSKRPVFVIEDGPYVGTPWLVSGAVNTEIPPDSSRTLTVLAPNTAVMPSLNSAFKVTAFTSGPTAVSASPAFLPNSDHTLLTPFGFSGVIPLGKTMVMRVQVLDRLGAPVRQAGVAVQLGQAVYSPAGLFATENSINGSPDGQSPVTSMTNSLGIATFRVRADQEQNAATTLQAWLGSAGPSGYSNRVIGWFGYSSSAAIP